MSLQLAAASYIYIHYAFKKKTKEGTVVAKATVHSMEGDSGSRLLVEKVKCTLVQALKFCRGRTAQRGVEVQLYPFMTTALEGVRGQRHAPAALYPLERPGTYCTGGWVGPRVGLDSCGKSRPPPGFDPRTVQLVASRYTDYATWPTQRCWQT